MPEPVWQYAGITVILDDDVEPSDVLIAAYMVAAIGTYFWLRQVPLWG